MVIPPAAKRSNGYAVGVFFTAGHAARCTARHGVGADAKPSSLVIGWLRKLATKSRSSER
jgi:hypothetical protein